MVQQSDACCACHEVDRCVDPLDGRGPRARSRPPRDRAGSPRPASRSRAASWPRTAASGASAGASPTIRRTSWMKPMSSMRSASSSTKMRTRRGSTLPSLDQVEQAARRGDQDVDAAAQRLDLRPLPTPPKTTACAAVARAVGREALADLYGELARRREDQGARLSSAARSRTPAAGAPGSAARRPPSCRYRSARSPGRRGPA